MRRITIFTLLFLFTSICQTVAQQTVVLSDSDTSAAKGPLISDGRITSAVSAAFTKGGQKKGFRFNLKAGDKVAIKYLILDKRPNNLLKTVQLPIVSLTNPAGVKTTLKINQRTNFYDSVSKANYLTLAEYKANAIAGTYLVDIAAKAKAEIIINIGEKEVAGGLESAIPAPAPSSSAAPTPTPTLTRIISLTEVKQNNTTSSCWVVIDTNVYDLTKWSMLHPGGTPAIASLCGTDGTSAFRTQHSTQSRPASVLAGYLIGTLAK